MRIKDKTEMAYKNVKSGKNNQKDSKTDFSREVEANNLLFTHRPIRILSC